MTESVLEDVGAPPGEVAEAPPAVRIPTIIPISSVSSIGLPKMQVEIIQSLVQASQPTIPLEGDEPVHIRNGKVFF